MRTMETMEVSTKGEAVTVSRTVTALGLAEEVCIEVVKMRNVEGTCGKEDCDREDS